MDIFGRCRQCEHYQHIVFIVSADPDEPPSRPGPCAPCPALTPIMQHINQDYAPQRELPIDPAVIVDATSPWQDTPLREIFTPREAAIYSLHRIGYSQQAIAVVVGISQQAVAKNISKIRIKLSG